MTEANGMGTPAPAHGEVPFEIERKFLIARPDTDMLLRQPGCSVTEIVQTYLCREGDFGRRVRMRGRDGAFVYTETKKKTISAMRRVELEREISREEYLDLLREADPDRRTIEKQRYCVPFGGQCFEIDVFPFWTDRAILEIELPSEDTPVCLPPFVTVLREVTDDPAYRNAALARRIPE